MSPNDLAFDMLIAITSMAICMAIIPIMMRVAPVIGMVDKPDNRKVHMTAIPRSGGIGIVIGVMVPLFLWLQPDRFITSLLVGCSILLLFGAWDDSRNIRPAFKFIGQLVAAITVVYYGDIYVFHFPFLGLDELPHYIGKPFTVIAIVGMINALNLSDGLDGLAGGEALISLAAIAYLSYQYDGVIAIAVAAASIGGIFGFLRFNSHPARIFMGDAGSQTLGFVLGVLVVYLSQQVNPVVSPVIVLLLLGLPVIDSLVVFYLRAKRGDSLVVAAKDHLHHRLLGVGFYHYESVIIIYSIQILFVVLAVLMPYESDILILTVYLSLCITLYFTVAIYEKKEWKAHNSKIDKPVFLSNVVYRHQYLSAIPLLTIEAGLSIFLIAAALMSASIPKDIGISSVIMISMLGLIIITGWLGIVLYRLIIFVAIGTSVYLLSEYPPAWLLKQIYLVYVFYILMTISAFVAARLAISEQFKITPLDYLVVIIAVIVAMAPSTDVGSSSMTWMVIQMIILFYSAELLLQRMDSTKNRFSGALFVSLLLISSRGLL